MMGFGAPQDPFAHPFSTLPSKPFTANLRAGAMGEACRGQGELEGGDCPLCAPEPSPISDSLCTATAGPRLSDGW